MPVPTDMVGDSISPLIHEVDARWTMAYAASLGDTHDCYFDTTAPGGVVAHPMFAVCPEWPVIVEGRELSDRWGISADEARQSVHATHDLTIHRLARPGDVLTTSLTYTGVEQRKPGAFATMRLETIDAAGELVATTEQGGMYLGVPTTGEDRPAEPFANPLDLPEPPGDALLVAPIGIPHGAAHTYTESARIWNPIHTDAAVAKAAGLDAIILHGTATLALGVSKVLDACADGDPTRVRRIIGRFRAMVFMPSTITVRILGEHQLADSTAIQFEVLNEAGAPAVDQGVVVLGA